MCLVKCAAITALANTMAFLHATVVLDFSNDPYEDPEIMCAKRNLKAIALWIKRIGTSAERVA